LPRLSPQKLWQADARFGLGQPFERIPHVSALQIPSRLVKGWLLRIMSELDQRAEEVFEAVLKLPPKERSAYFDRACGGDAIPGKPI
jgi:hypothetical protein